MHGKVCLITGASRGIGRALAIHLATRDTTLLLHASTRETIDRTVAEIRELSGNPDIHGLAADFADQDAVRRMVAEVRQRTERLDLLVNNAAIFNTYRISTADGHEMTFAVNHLAHFILTNGLVDLLTAAAPSRVVILASEAHQRAHHVEDWESRTGYSGYQAYARSKLANVMFGYDLAHRLEGTGVMVNSCHPGLADTGFVEKMFDRWWARWVVPIAKTFTIPVEKAVETPLMLATSPELGGVTGKYFKDGHAIPSSLVSHDPTIGARLWNISLRYTGELPDVEITGEHIAH
jgi:NAD(P)-dependent dehydrogenase (short-subunit alcohol dehydrogenase family)